MFRFVIVLGVICVIAALVLGVTYNATKPLIAAQQEKEKQLGLESVLSGADEYKKRTIGATEYYEGYRHNRLIGYVIHAEGKGYADRIDMLVGIDTTGKILGIEVLYQQETPGLGAQCTEIKEGQKEPWFLRQFKGKTTGELELKNIEAITGATITSEAILKAVKESITEFLSKVRK